MNRAFCIAPFLALMLAGCGAQSMSAAATSHTSQSGAHASAAPAYWVRYTDPAEGAFSLDVPVGWQVQGGMYRYGYFDVRWMMNVRSLDGAMIIRLSDASVPPYALPGPDSGQPGQMYSKPRQFQMIVSDYQSADAYAPIYAKHRFGSVCTKLTPDSHPWHPTVPAAFKADPSAQQSTTATIAYRCASSAGQRTALVYASTVQYGVQYGTGFWTVGPLVSILTTSADRSVATAVAQRMMNTWQKNPQWAAYQNKLTQEGLQQIMASFQGFMQQMQAYDQARRSAMDSQVAGFESRMNAQAAQVSAFGDTLTGLQNASDPLTGEQFQVWTGPQNEYFRNGQGVTINSNVSPGPDFHQINTQP
jgi:hypothetical protein